MCDAHARPSADGMSRPAPHTGLSRRSVLRAGALGFGGALVAGGLSGGLALPAWAADDRPEGALADGAPSGDPQFAQQFAAAQQRSTALSQSRTMAATMAETSYNDFPVGTPGSTIGITSFPIPGSSVTLQLKGGDAGTILAYVARRFNAEVEPLIRAQCGGYEYRRNVNNPSVWSNHASGTAMDLNWSRHPNGAKGTFSAGQVAAIRRILSACNGTVYWGGDYRGTTDEMHFEINVSPWSSKLRDTVASINGIGKPTRTISLRAVVNDQYVCAEAAGGQPLIANRSSVGPWERFDVYDMGSDDVALRAVNGKFVCAESGGASALIANRDVPAVWEKFHLQRYDDGSYSLQSYANLRVVCAELAGYQSLIANRPGVGLWERFIIADA